MWKLIVKGLLARKRRFLLTFFSVVLGVSFISGSYVFTDSITSTFNNLFTDIYAGVDITVRSADEGEFSEEVFEQIKDLPGIEQIDPQVGSDIILLDKEGEPIIPGGPPSLGFSWTPIESLNPTNIKEGNGRPPTQPGEVALDVSTAEQYGFTIGDTAMIQAAGEVEEFTIVGLLNFGSLDSFAGAILTTYELNEAQRLFGLEGFYSEIAIKVDDNYQIENVKNTILSSVMNSYDVEVVTGDQQTAEDLEEINEGLNFITVFFLAFAGVAIFVATFIIQNTFRIIIAQRSKELALLRSIGSTRRQITSMVVAEAILVGLVASIAGLFAGIGLAELIKVLVDSVGIDLPSGAAELRSRTVIVSICVGMLVTVLSALLPARRASKIPPVQAMSQHENTAKSKSLLKRTAIGLFVVLIGGVALWLGLSSRVSNELAVVAAGSGAMFIGVSMLAPFVVKPFSRIVGMPFKPLYKVTAEIAIGNSQRSPRRTASTSAALMIGVALISLISILGSSVKSTVDEIITESFPADFVVLNQAITSGGPDSFSGGVNRDFTDRVRALDELQTVSVQRYNFADLDADGDTSSRGPGAFGSIIIGVEPDTLNDVIKLKPSGDSYSGLNELNTVYVNENTLEDRGLSIGQTVAIGFEGSGVVDLKIAGSFEEQFDSDYLLGLNTYEQYFSDTQDTSLYINIAPDVTAQQAREALEREKERYPILQISDTTELTEQAEQQIDQILGLIWALLGLAVIISVIGITNTLTLSISERQREIGMLRAIGMTRKQVKQTIRIESVIIAIFGAVLGVVMGIFFGWALIQALESEGFTGFSVPIMQLVIIVVLSAFAGVVASMLPSRRAAKTDLLEAIATE